MVHGAIHTSWVLKKTELLLIEIDQIKELAKEIWSDTTRREKKMSTLSQGSCHMEQAMIAINSVYEQIEATTTKRLHSQLEQQLTGRMTELKQAQEAVQKGIQRKRKRSKTVRLLLKQRRIFSYLLHHPKCP